MERTAAETRDLSARLKYLHESAHLLTVSSPQTSSFLQAQYGHLLSENGLAAPDSRRGEVCGACGTILIPGLSCKVSQETGRTSKNQTKGARIEKREAAKHAKDGGACKMKIYSCLRCASQTRLQIPTSKARMDTRKGAKASIAEAPAPAAPAQIAPTKAGTAAAAAASASTPSQPATAPNATNASSKKRAKARKGGLQAMLADSKKNSSSASKGFGLDLMDLMRSD